MAPKKPFAVPRDRAAWNAQREAIRRVVLEALGPVPPRPSPPVVTPHETGSRGGVTVRRLSIQAGPGEPIGAVLATPSQADVGHKVPAVLFLSDGPERPGGPLRPGPDSTPPAITLAQRGFAVLATDWRFYTPGTPPSDRPAAPWSTSETAAEKTPEWALSLRDDQAALDALLARPEVDPKRVGVAGVGLAGTRAWWLMALDERVACGVSAGGLTRLSDWQAAQGPGARPLAPWASKLLEHFDTEAVLALCAPRHLQIMHGERDPMCPVAGAMTLFNTALRTYRLLGVDGPAHTLFGDQGGDFTLLEWDMLLETFDKVFLPQGPTPLGHPPEPEPEVDDRFVNPAEHGLAGWVSEMSQRPGTWTWHDGVIVCKPGPSEYGWLRLPVEFDDFILQVEWKVPQRGNSGIFLRADPVDWSFPPSGQNRTRVLTRGLEWPSRTGLELQSQDDPGHADKYSSGSLYRHAAPCANPTRPPGEWNRDTVRCRGLRVEIWCNGEQVLDTTLDKYPTLRHPPLKGYIGLQNHGVPAEFRNIRYRHLGPESQAAGQP
jgi:dienelactone hydrolase